MSDKELWRPAIPDAINAMDVMCGGVREGGECFRVDCDDCLLHVSEDLEDQTLEVFKQWLIEVLTDS